MKKIKIIYLVMIVTINICIAASTERKTMTYEEAVARIPERKIPDFWMVDAVRIKDYLTGLKKGKVNKLTESAGERDIYVVTYGEKETMPRLANFNSAIAAREPQVYCDKDARKKPVILFLGPVHGAEVEGLIGLMNFINIMETGKDLRGKDYQYIQLTGRKM
ncbi:MAG: hypothetical protein A2Y10_08995 [Planctomycetes bacterium GWF2_41_51]|nr:MAG: hypothetical protein A2Y10_08995 [Planctomycetes bacterium GWF2_41_51]